MPGAGVLSRLMTWRRASERRIARAHGAPDADRSAPAAEDLSAPRIAQNPFVHYEDLRREGSVHHLPRDDSWIVLGYAQVQEAFGQPRLYSSRLMATLDPALLGAGGPAHAALRRGLAPSLSAAVVDSLHDEVDDAAQALLSPLLRGHDFDVVSEFAAPLAEFVAARALGFDTATVAALTAAVGDSEVETLTLFERLGSIDGAPRRPQRVGRRPEKAVPGG